METANGLFQFQSSQFDMFPVSPQSIALTENVSGLKEFIMSYLTTNNVQGSLRTSDLILIYDNKILLDTTILNTIFSNETYTITLVTPTVQSHRIRNGIFFIFITGIMYLIYSNAK